MLVNDGSDECNPEDIEQIHKNQPQRNIPEFVLPRTTKKSNDTEINVRLFESCT